MYTSAKRIQKYVNRGQETVHEQYIKKTAQQTVSFQKDQNLDPFSLLGPGQNIRSLDQEQEEG